MSYSLNDGLYCTKWAYLHFIFGQLLQELKSSMMDCVPIFTIRKRSLAKVMFYTCVSFCSQGGGAQPYPPDADPPL